MMKHKVSYYLFLSIILLNGCALFPYEDEFSCNKPDNLGKCISPTEAYEEISTGQSTSPHMKPYSEQTRSERNSNGQPVSGTSTKRENQGGYDGYVDANYREVAELLEKPITPLIKPVQTAELLILPYSDSANVLKGERYIHVILKTPEFVMGDYLKRNPISTKTLFNE